MNKRITQEIIDGIKNFFEKDFGRLFLCLGFPFLISFLGAPLWWALTVSLGIISGFTLLEGKEGKKYLLDAGKKKEKWRTKIWRNFKKIVGRGIAYTAIPITLAALGFPVLAGAYVGAITLLFMGKNIGKSLLLLEQEITKQKEDQEKQVALIEATRNYSPATLEQRIKKAEILRELFKNWEDRLRTLQEVAQSKINSKKLLEEQEKEFIKQRNKILEDRREAEKTHLETIKTLKEREERLLLSAETTLEKALAEAGDLEQIETLRAAHAEVDNLIAGINTPVTDDFIPKSIPSSNSNGAIPQEKIEDTENTVDLPDATKDARPTENSFDQSLGEAIENLPPIKVENSAKEIEQDVQAMAAKGES